MLLVHKLDAALNAAMDEEYVPPVDLKFTPRQSTSAFSSLSFESHASVTGLEWIPVLEAPVNFGVEYVRTVATPLGRTLIMTMNYDLDVGSSTKRWKKFYFIPNAIHP